MSRELPKTADPATQAIHAGCKPDTATGAVTPPIYQSSTFAYPNTERAMAIWAGREPGFVYTRMGNPTTRAVEEAVTALEGGYAALCTASGMAAVTAVYFTLLGLGRHMVGTDAMYNASRAVVERDFARFGVESSFVDTSDIKKVEAAMRPNTTLVMIETPANPTMRITDIAACAAVAHSRHALLCVDNTFASPMLQRPFEFGADIVVHSATKFLNGHADLVGGVIVAKTKEVYGQLRHTVEYLGGVMDPHQAYLLHRGLRTLSLRIETATKNALALADFLRQHPKIEWIRYPGLPDNPQFELAKKQMRGFGALMAFGVKGGLDAGRRLLDNLKIATLAVSLGGLETLIQHPASMTHVSMSKQAREAAGITDGLIRLSVGCEGTQDLIADFRQALEHA